MFFSSRKQKEPQPEEKSSQPSAQAETGVIFIYTVCANREEAQKMAASLLESRLIGCANIFQPCKSYFRWDNKLAESEEIPVIFKTRSVLYDRVTEAVTRLHSYSVPCIVAWPVGQGFPPFLKWISDETTLL